MDILKSLIVLAISLVSAACAAPELEYPLHMRLADNAPTEAKSGVREAAETWNSLSREKLGYDIIIIDEEYEHTSAKRALNNRQHDIFSTEMNEYEKVMGQDWLGICVRQQRSHGFYVDVAFAPERKVYSWSAGFTDTAYYFIALHELGHALGLTHTSDPQSLMYGSSQEFSDIPLEITSDAERAFCEIHGCE